MITKKGSWIDGMMPRPSLLSIWNTALLQYNLITETEQVKIVNEYSPWSCGHYYCTHIHIYTYAICTDTILYIQQYSIVEEHVYMCAYITQYFIGAMAIYTPVWGINYSVITLVTILRISNLHYIFCLNLLSLVFFYYSYVLS